MGLGARAFQPCAVGDRRGCHEQPTVGAAAAAAIAQNPDSAYSRILCPRKLAPHRAYHAFLVPAFESGRLAGLGIDPATVFDKPANELFATASVLGVLRGQARPPASSRITTAGTSAPARAATSSTSSGC